MRPAVLFIEEEKRKGRKFERCDICQQLFPLVLMNARGIRKISSARGGVKSLWGGDIFFINFCSTCVRNMYEEIEAKKNNPVPSDGVDGLEFYYEE